MRKAPRPVLVRDMGQVLTVTDSDFDQIMNDNKLVLVDFWAPWCGPCKALSPILEQISNEREIVIAKVNTDSDSKNAAKYGVRGIPAMFLFKDGKMIDNKTGMMPKSQLLGWLDQHITADDF